MIWVLRFCNGAEYNSYIKDLEDTKGKEMVISFVLFSIYSVKVVLSCDEVFKIKIKV